ncbi:MAG: MFS transporter [Bacteroidetes bacterium]|nr:MAG: MFS transporter [Bacteroidota bacterium]
MSDKYSGLRKASLLVGSTLTVMAGAIVAPALPLISREFADVAGIELLSRLVLTLPALFMGILAPIAGYFTDRVGRRKVLLFSLILYAVAGTTGLYLHNLYWILAGRALLGIAVGGLITAVITLIGDYFEGEERSRFMGLQAAFAGLGGLIFISLGGVLADINWRMPFVLYIVSLVLWVMSYVSVSEPQKKIESTPKSGAGSSVNNGTKIPGIIIFVYIITFFSAIVFYMIPVQMPFMLSDIEGVTNARIGFAIAFMNVASVTTSVNYGRVRRKFSFPAILFMVYMLVFVGYMVISQSANYYVMILGIIFCGLGFGLMLPNLNLWLISLAPPDMRGRLVGYLNMFLFLGMFASPIALQPLVKASNIHQTFFIIGLVIFFTGIFFLFYELRNRKLSTVKE